VTFWTENMESQYQAYRSSKTKKEKLTSLQVYVLQMIGDACESIPGGFWVSWNSGLVGSEAGAVRALWRKGLAKQHCASDGTPMGYDSTITDKGRQYLAALTQGADHEQR
jgi:hypothetical protein